VREKKLTWVLSRFWMVTETALFEATAANSAVCSYNCKRAVNGKKEKLFTRIFNFNLINDRFVTVHNKSSKIPPSASMNFAIRVRSSCVFRLSRSSRGFYASSSIQNAGEQFVWCTHLCFVNFLFSSNKTKRKKNPWVGDGDSNSLSLPLSLSL
jgi:hypothetical protein